jgi:outer membrane protein insertion porin family
VEAGFGVGNVVGSRVSAEWGTRNLFGTGRTLRGKAEYGFDLFRSEGIDFSQLQLDNIFWRYDLIFQQRRVFGTKLNFGAETFIERDRSVQDVSVRRLGVAVGALRRFGRRTEVATDFSVEDIERQALGGEIEKSSSHILGVSGSRDGRDFVLNPRTGIYRILRLQVAGGVLGGKNDFYTASASWQWYDPVVRWAVLAVRARFGYGAGYGRSPSVPFENRYFLGGGNSVRGYNENVLGPRAMDSQGRETVVGGEFLLLGNIEVRHSIPLLSRWNFSGAVFIDGGNVWDSTSSVKLKDFRISADAAAVTVDDFRYSAGLGLRYNTPVGPIRLDYGIPIKRDTYNDDSGRFHLTLGQIF